MWGYLYNTSNDKFTHEDSPLNPNVKASFQ